MVHKPAISKVLQKTKNTQKIMAPKIHKKNVLLLNQFCHSIDTACLRSVKKLINVSQQRLWTKFFGFNFSSIESLKMVDYIHISLDSEVIKTNMKDATK